MVPCHLSDPFPKTFSALLDFLSDPSDVSIDSVEVNSDPFNVVQAPNQARCDNGLECLLVQQFAQVGTD